MKHAESGCARRDDDTLALMALGEFVDEATTQHVAGCASCSTGLAELRRVVLVGRSITEADLPQTPPADLWQRISTQITEAAHRSDGSPAEATVIPMRRKRVPRWAIGAVAAGIGIIVGAGAVWLGLAARPAPQVVASAQLAPMDGFTSSGSAALQRTDAGLQLAVSLEGLPQPVDGYYEVWMATADTSTMVAIGTFNPSEKAVFVLPAGMDSAAFTVVDVSLEHFDGDTGHSATSVARGTF